MAATSMNRKVNEDEIKEALSTIKTLQAYQMWRRFATVKG
jgi:2-haloacid dehalogenase